MMKTARFKSLNSWRYEQKIKVKGVPYARPFVTSVPFWVSSKLATDWFKVKKQVSSFLDVQREIMQVPVSLIEGAERLKPEKMGKHNGLKLDRIYVDEVRFFE